MAALPHYPEFDYESQNNASKWTKYVNRLRNYFTEYNIENDKRQKATLLTFVGEEINDLIDELPSEQTTPEKNETHFDKLVLAVQNHFNPENNTEYNRFIFRKKTNKQTKKKHPNVAALPHYPEFAPGRSNKLRQNDRNHIQTNGTDALRRRQLYYKTYHIH